MKSNKNGFTLIEIMMVVIIISLILTPLMYWYSLYEQQRKTNITKDRVASAYQKLSEFKKFYNFYPLPAGLLNRTISVYGIYKFRCIRKVSYLYPAFIDYE
jgi:prepilin-type N-terminal cleavage/methylation domain-containing protein